jgi:fructose-1,6-bisphosphatase
MNKISTILRNAANNYLWNGENYSQFAGKTALTEAEAANSVNKCRLSCDTFNPYHNKSVNCAEMLKCKNFLEELGLNAESYNAFNEFKVGEERQSVRYAWLMFAADIAEEEGN